MGRMAVAVVGPVTNDHLHLRRLPFMTVIIVLAAFSTVGCALFGRGDPGGGVQLDNRNDTTVDVVFVPLRGVKWTITVPVRRA